MLDNAPDAIGDKKRQPSKFQRKKKKAQSYTALEGESNSLKDELPNPKIVKADKAVSHPPKAFHVVGNPNYAEEGHTEAVDIPVVLNDWASESDAGYFGVLCAVKNQTGVLSIRTHIKLQGKLNQKQILISGEDISSVRAASMLLNSHMRCQISLKNLQNRSKTRADEYAAYKKDVEKGLYISFSVDPSFLSLIMGRNNSRIKSVQDKTNCKITIENSGHISISGTNSKSVILARQLVDFTQVVLTIGMEDDRSILTDEFLSNLCKTTECATISTHEIDQDLRVSIIGTRHTVIEAQAYIENLLMWVKPYQQFTTQQQIFTDRLDTLINKEPEKLNLNFTVEDNVAQQPTVLENPKDTSSSSYGYGSNRKSAFSRRRPSGPR